jgi:inner membrane protein involved in colicin E2 resistance
MSARRMTAKQMDAYVKRSKFYLFCFAVMLMLDGVFIGVLRPAGGTKVMCVLIAAASLAACLYLLRKLYQAGYKELNSGSLPGESDFPAQIVDLDVPEVLSSFYHDD